MEITDDNKVLFCPNLVHKILKKNNIKFEKIDLISLRYTIRQNLEDRKAHTILEPFLYNINSVANRSNPSMLHALKKNLVTHRIPVINLRDILCLSKYKSFYKLVKKIFSKKYIFLICLNETLSKLIKPVYVLDHISKILNLKRDIIEKRITESLLFFKLFYEKNLVKNIQEDVNLVNLLKDITLPE